MMEGAEPVGCPRVVAGASPPAELEDLGVDECPAFAEWVLDRRSDQAFHIGAGGVFGTEAVAFDGVESTDEKGPEDRRLDIAPVYLRCAMQDPELWRSQGEDLGLAEEVAIEVEESAVAEPATGVHRLPELFECAGELIGIVEADLLDDPEEGLVV